MDKDITVLHRILRATGERQKVLASNIANTDTPGYKAKDVKFGNFLDREVKLLTTDPKHLGGSNDEKNSSHYTIEENPSWGDKNNVELNREVAKMTENALVHDAAVKILSTKIRMYKNAIGGGR